jgi:hypothetical protein
MRLLLALVALTVLAPCAHAQPQAVIADQPGHASARAVHSVALTIAGYARVEASETDVWLNLDPGAGVLEDTRTVRLSVATNLGVGQVVSVQVDGDLDGVRLDVVPVPGSLVVERVARAGSTGAAAAVSFTEPGSRPLITGVGQAVATMDVQYTVSALSNATPPGPRRVTLTYTITS